VEGLALVVDLVVLVGPQRAQILLESDDSYIARF
jgi:hypothetical protein